MTRHRIEIEFDATVEEAEHQLRLAKAGASLGRILHEIENPEVSMTPVANTTP